MKLQDMAITGQYLVCSCNVAPCLRCETIEEGSRSGRPNEQCLADALVGTPLPSLLSKNRRSGEMDPGAMKS